MLLNCGVGEDSWESLGLQGDPTSPLKEISPEYSLEGLMLKLKLQYFGHLMWRIDHWKRPWCWEKLKVGGEGDDRGWDGWMASFTQWAWVWACSGSWWWTGKPGMLQSMGSQSVGHDWATELNWTGTAEEGSHHTIRLDVLWLYKSKGFSQLFSSKWISKPYPEFIGILDREKLISKANLWWENHRMPVSSWERELTQKGKDGTFWIMILLDILIGLYRYIQVHSPRHFYIYPDSHHL